MFIGHKDIASLSRVNSVVEPRQSFLSQSLI